jgi:TRAP-type C4-dicarboxylate transport system permease small subunit
MLRILDTLEVVLKAVIAILIAVIVGLTFYGVPMRYAFHQPQAWTMEVSRFAFLWLVMLGAAVVARQAGHIRIAFVLDRLPQRVRFVWEMVMSLAMLAFCWVLVEQGAAIFPLVSEARSPTMGLSMGWFYLSIPIGGALIGLFLIEQLVARCLQRGWRNPA